MGLFGLFKSKEEKERELKEIREKIRIEKEKKEKFKSAAGIEARKIINYFETQSKKELEKNKKKYSSEFYSVHHDISNIKDIEVKIYTVLYVAEHFFTGSSSEYENVECFFKGEPEKSELYNVYSIMVELAEGEEEWLPDVVEGEDYWKSESFKHTYCVKSLKFEDEYKGLSILIFKNKIYYEYDKSTIKIKEHVEKWRNPYDRGGLLMNR